ncbi:MAG: CHAD domain-containing protein [Synechococcus lacustris]
MDSWGQQGLENLQGSFRRIKRLRSELLQRKDPEALHQLRVNLRRVRSCVEQGAAALELPRCLGAGSVARQGRPLGRARDLDVINDQLSLLLLPQLPSQEQALLNPLLEQLEGQRRQARRLVNSHLVSPGHRHWLQRCGHWLEAPRLTPLGERPLLELLPDLQLRSLGSLLLQLGWQVEDPGSEARSLHELRKTVKAVRYQAEAFRSCYGLNKSSGLSYSSWIDELKRLQELLGNLQDLVVLRKLLGKKLLKQLPALEEKLQASQAENWVAWLGLRGRYRDQASRQALRLLVVQMESGPTTPPTTAP